jgi:hypothetical protein
MFFLFRSFSWGQWQRRHQGTLLEIEHQYLDMKLKRHYSVQWRQILNQKFWFYLLRSFQIGSNISKKVMLPRNFMVRLEMIRDLEHIMA